MSCGFCFHEARVLTSDDLHNGQGKINKDKGDTEDIST